MYELIPSSNVSDSPDIIIINTLSLRYVLLFTIPVSCKQIYLMLPYSNNIAMILRLDSNLFYFHLETHTGILFDKKLNVKQLTVYKIFCVHLH